MVKPGSVKIENLLIGLTSTPRRFKAAGNVKVEQTAFESADHRAGEKQCLVLRSWWIGYSGLNEQSSRNMNAHFRSAASTHELVPQSGEKQIAFWGELVYQ